MDNQPDTLFGYPVVINEELKLPKPGEDFRFSDGKKRFDLEPVGKPRPVYGSLWRWLRRKPLRWEMTMRVKEPESCN